MNRNNNTSNITESAMVTGILIITALISSIVPIARFFYPTPAVILAKRRGIKYAALSLFAADMIIIMLLGISTGISYLILFTPFALALAYGVYRDEEANKTILYGSAAYMISFVAFILLLDALMGVNFVEQMRTGFSEAYKYTEEMLYSLPGGVNGESIEQALQMIRETKAASEFILTNLFPAIIIMSSVMVSYVNYLIARKFSSRFSIIIRKHEGLSHFSFPRTFMIAMAALLLISLMLGVLKFNVRVIQLNLFYIIFLAMALQGFAVIKFLIEKRIDNKSFRTIMTFMMFYMAFFVLGIVQIIALIGLVDLAINLRKLNRVV